VTPLRLTLAAGLMSGAFVSAVPAQAEVTQSSSAGFVVTGSATTTRSAEDVWYVLIEPREWWNGEHTWSGEAGNLQLGPKGGGCFCEELPLGGSVEHMRVIYAAPGEMLRMSGALGPLQGEGLAGTLTIEMSTAGSSIDLSWTYVVGGYARFPLEDTAVAVDLMLAEQMNRLVSRLENPELRR
jgi:hypothetical protein